MDLNNTKGRGSLSNTSSRFEKYQREAFDDGWPAEERPLLRTAVFPEISKSILSTNDSPDIPFSQSINPYKGCEHGCIYCFARPTHTYLGMSAGLDFESKIVSKPNAPQLLEKAFQKKTYVCDVLALGANTDPYQPVEHDLGITRAILEVLQKYQHPVSIVTKSALILRDVDLLHDLAQKNLVNVFLSITTLDPHLARIMEPRAASPAKRLRVLRMLRDVGIPCGVLSSPMILGLNDHEMENILDQAHQAGAQGAAYILLRLPRETQDLFIDWLQLHFPDRANKVLGFLRVSRGGKLYDPTYGLRMHGQSHYASLLQSRFLTVLKKLKISQHLPPLATQHFSTSTVAKQMSLFDP